MTQTRNERPVMVAGPVVEGTRIPKPYAVRQWYNPDGGQFVCDVPFFWAECLLKDGDVILVPEADAARFREVWNAQHAVQAEAAQAKADKLKAEQKAKAAARRSALTAFVAETMRAAGPVPEPKPDKPVKKAGGEK